MMGPSALIADKTPNAPVLDPGWAFVKQRVIDWQSPASPAPKTPTPPAVFELENRGVDPVRVLSVESGCGCAKPRVTPLLIEPGGRAKVEVVAPPISVGERVVPITLKTDAKHEPDVQLQLRVVGSRIPPFLLRASGELTYFMGYSPTETRELVVETIESLEPGPHCDLPFIHCAPPTISDSPHPQDQGVVGRVYRHRVSFASPPPEEGFSGRITVADPWDESRVMHVNIFGEPNPEVKVVPSSLVVRAGAAEIDSSTRFMLKLRDPDADPRVDFAWEGASPFTVEEVPDQRMPTFALRRARPVEEEGGKYTLIVRLDRRDAPAVTVPVYVIAASRP